MRFSVSLRNGAIGGAVAGLVSGALLYLLTEPTIRRALVVEEARPGGSHHEEPLVSRGMQVAAGFATAVVVGILFGMVFGVVFAKLRHRLPGGSDHSRAVWLAVFGFGAFTLMPALAVPANPPAVGDPATVDQRTLGYVLAVLLGLLVAAVVAALDQLLRRRGVDPSVRAAADLFATLALAGLALWAMPATPGGIPADVPADVVWDFRVASLGQLAAMWLTLGSVFGLLAARSRRGASRRQPVLG